MAELEEGQYELDGLLMGVGTQYRCNIEPRGLPSIRIVDRDRAQTRGVETGPDFMGGRVLVGDIGCDGNTPAEGLALFEALAAKLIPGVPRTLRMRPAGYPAARRVSVVSRKAPVSPLAGRRVYTVAVEWLAPDPLLYADAEDSEVTGLGSVTGGLAFPHGFPHGFGLATPGGILAENVGNSPVKPIATVTAGVGGVSNIVLEHADRGEQVIWSSFLPQDSFLIFDFDLLTVTLNGPSASRYEFITSHDWWALDPGVNEIRFAGTGDASLLLAWSSGSSV